MKIIIKENQRGLLFKNGKFVKMLKTGNHTIFNFLGYSIEVMDLNEAFNMKQYDLSVFLKDEELRKELDIIEVSDETLAIHNVNGRYCEILVSGKYAFWNVYDKNTFQMVDIKEAEVSDDVPRYIFEYMPKTLFKKLEVFEYQIARLYFDQKLVKTLSAGTYYFWNNGIKVDAGLTDTRVLQLDISGQEIMTQDKVGLRINFVCNYRITDHVRIFTEIKDYESQIHILLQLILREYIGKFKFDELLDNKEEIAEYVLNRLKAKEKEYFVEFLNAGVKDIILPGEIRDIMNMVLIAEKKAQANVISRREEVASTRSLLNTAKLLDENQTLYKLKELEYLEKICENVGNISVTGGTDLLTQLTQVLRG